MNLTNYASSNLFMSFDINNDHLFSITDISLIIQYLNKDSECYLYLFDSLGDYVGDYALDFLYREQESFFRFNNIIIRDCRDWQEITGVESSIFYFGLKDKDL